MQFVSLFFHRVDLDASHLQPNQGLQPYACVSRESQGMLMPKSPALTGAKQHLRGRCRLSISTSKATLISKTPVIVRPIKKAQMHESGISRQS